MGLADIPFYGAYAQRRQMNEAQPMQELKQASAAMGLMGALRQQQQDEQLRQAIAATGGDVEKAMAAAIASGNLAGAAKLAPVVEARKKASQGQAIGSGGLRLPDGTIIPPAARPGVTHAAPEIVRLQEYLGGLPEGDPRRVPIEARIKMLGERQGTVNVYSGSLTAAVDENGNPVFVQPSGRADVPPRVVEGVRPPPNAADAKAAASARAEEVTLDSVRQRIQSMTDKLQQNSGMVGPLGIARRVGETVAGVAAPDMPTPALDYQNELRLLLADVRKVVEKDPNLSNQERLNLYETLGGGTFQTPGSAFRTLNNVLGYMENKRMSGPGRAARVEARGTPSVGAVEQGYRFKGGDPAKPENWEKVN